VTRKNLNQLILENDIASIWNIIKPELARTHYKHNDEFEDLMSIGLIRIIEVLPKANLSLPPIESKKFLLTCARNAIVDYLRKFQHHKRFADVFSFESEQMEFFPQKELEQTNLDQLQKAMTFLSIRQQRLIRMFYFDNVGLLEISRKLNKKPKDTKILLEQALDKLRDNIRV
jgi:RNA polymerase sigma factor (sigma-70 family)